MDRPNRHFASRVYWMAQPMRSYSDFVVNPQTNLHGWRIQKVSGEYQCSVLTGQLFSIITPSHEGGLCRMDFAAYRQEVAWTTYGVKNITVLDEPIYSPGTERYL